MFLTHVCDEYWLLQRNIRQRQITSGQSAFVRLSWAFVLFVVYTLKMRGNVCFPVAGCTEVLFTMGARKRPQT